MKAYDILERAYTTDIAQHIVGSYKEIENNYFMRKWKASELDAGHFVEAARRLLELELMGTYTPFEDKLSNFTDAVLKQYEQASGHESFRMLIPRALKSIYNIRSKRGVGHIAGVSPNEMDSTYILYSVKWILAELVRIKSGLPVPDTQKIVDDLVERRISLIWKQAGIRRVLVPGLRAREKILILLYDESPLMASELQKMIGYRNATQFNQILRALDAQVLIQYGKDVACHISPTGKVEAEKILSGLN